MSGAGFDGDRVVALVGVALALVLVMRSDAFRNLAARKRVIYAVIWAVVLGLIAAVAERYAH